MKPVSAHVAQKAKKTPYIQLDHRIKEAPALSRTTIAIYEALLWHRREKDSCWAGYAKIGKRAKVKSKTTIALHLKVLQKVGLTVTKRRGYKQSNINYPKRASELNAEVLQNLQEPHDAILAAIAKERTQAVHKRLTVSKMHRAKRGVGMQRQKSAREGLYAHPDEVQLLDAKKEVFHTSSRYSSNHPNDSKITREEEQRGGDFTRIGVYLRTARMMPLSRATGSLPEVPAPGTGILPVKKSSPRKTAVEPLTADAKIREVMALISRDIRDERHRLENTSQAIRLFRKIQEIRPISEDGFVQRLWNARGLTREILPLLDRPGAYYFTVLRRSLLLSG
jgi:predicted transcriptional regulator